MAGKLLPPGQVAVHSQQLLDVLTHLESHKNHIFRHVNMSLVLNVLNPMYDKSVSRLPKLISL